MTSPPDQSQSAQTAAPGDGHTPASGKEHPAAGGDWAPVARARRPPTIEDEFLTVAEVAAVVRLNQQTIRNWIQDSKLPSLHVGGRRVRILRRDLDQLTPTPRRYPESMTPPRAPRGGVAGRGASSGAARSALPSSAVR